MNKSRALRTANDRHAQRVLDSELFRLEAAAESRYTVVMALFDSMEKAWETKRQRDKDELWDVRRLMGEANEKIRRREAEMVPRKTEVDWLIVVGLSVGVILGLLLVWWVWT